MSDDRIGRILIFFKKFFRTGKSDLVDVFLHILACHADAMIADRESAGFLVDRHGDFHVAELAFVFSERRQRL